MNLSLSEKSQRELTRFLKFSVVGTIGAVIDFGLLYLLHSVLEINIILSNTCSFTAAVLSNFIWNRYWTYPDSRSKPVQTQLRQFFLVNIAGWGINTGILLLLRFPFANLVNAFSVYLPSLGSAAASYRVGYNLAKVFATILVMFWNFGINRIWTYSDAD
jgi:putative flippase GtrA